MLHNKRLRTRTWQKKKKKLQQGLSQSFYNCQLFNSSTTLYITYMHTQYIYTYIQLMLQVSLHIQNKRLRTRTWQNVFPAGALRLQPDFFIDHIHFIESTKTKCQMWNTCICVCVSCKSVLLILLLVLKESLWFLMILAGWVFVSRPFDSREHKNKRAFGAIAATTFDCLAGASPWAQSVDKGGGKQKPQQRQVSTHSPAVWLRSH